MPSNASFQRKYYSVAYADLETIPKVAGNVIATWDTDGFYYDVGNPTSGTIFRRKANGIEFVGSLSEARQEATTIFVINTGTTLDESGNTINTYAGYRWNDDITPPAFEEVFTNFHDFNVRSTANSSTAAYIVGSPDQATGIGTLIKNPNIYLTASGNKIHGNLEGKADNATNADNATKAQNDNNGTAITTYLHDVSATPAANPGTTITFTLGDGSTTKTIITSDTTYDVFTSLSKGLVDKTSITTQSDSTGLLLSGSGWIDMNNISFPTVDKARKDADGNVITSTYVKDASFDNAERELTLTYGDDSTGNPISIPDTTYGEVTTSTPGLVPALPTTDATVKFFRGDKQWATVPSFAGSTPGLVPTAAAADAGKFLKGNGTWGGAFGQGVDGLVPGPSSANHADSLRADGTWDTCPDTKNTAGATQDAAKLFLVGAKAQTSEPQTYSNSMVFIDGNKLYQSNGATPTPTPVQVVDISSTQTLSNKSFLINGVAQALGDASTKTVNSAFDPTDPGYDANKLPTNGAVADYVDTAISNVQTAIDAKVDSSTLAPAYDDTTTSYAVGDLCVYADDNGVHLYRCNTAITAPAGDFDDTKWDQITIADAINGISLTGTLTAGSTTLTIQSPYITTNAVLDIHTSIYGLQPTSVLVSLGQVDLTFAAQASDVVVKVKLI